MLILDGRLVSKILGFESEDGGAIPPHSRIKVESIRNYVNFTLLGLGIQKIFILVSFLEKQRTKKLVSLYVFINNLNQAVYKQKNFFFSFIKFVLLSFLNLIKLAGFITNWYLIPAKLFLPLILNKNYICKWDLGLVYMRHALDVGFKHLIQVFSKPSRSVYLTFGALHSLIGLSSKNQRVFVINTVYGLLLHNDALKYRIGGQLICLV